jgi:hypothetical protein
VDGQLDTLSFWGSVRTTAADLLRYGVVDGPKV